MNKWVIYGAYGYTGRLTVEAAKKLGMKPILSGRSREPLEKLATTHGLESKVASVDDAGSLKNAFDGATVVLNCAGPFSATARPVMEACIQAGAHYLDITGEISVFELAQSLGVNAAEHNVMLCPGVGFDVIPTDCLARALSEQMPDATALTLGFDSRSPLSPGTAKTSVEGLSHGGAVRRDGKIERVPLAYKTRKIDFGDGEKLAMTIPWGDVSTAFHTTGIPNIETYIPASPRMVKSVKRLNHVRPLLGLGPVQAFAKWRIGRKVRGPNDDVRESTPMHVWGEVRNAAGKTLTGRIRTANGYDVTVSGSLAVVTALLGGTTSIAPRGALTPSRLMGKDLVTRLPGSGRFEFNADND